MPNNTYALVKEFHEIFRAAVSENPTITTGFEELRFRLIREEVAETIHAIMSFDEVEFADGLGDVDYVVEGAAITFGLNLEESFGYAMTAHAHYKYYELIGLLVLAVRELCGLLVDAEGYFDTYPERLRIGYLEATLASIKAIVWTIAGMSEKPIPLGEIVAAIHQSNMTKLGEDGKPMFNEYQKVIKGPNYVPPTARIKEILGV